VLDFRTMTTVLGLGSAVVLTSAASAQLTPERLYNGVNRPIPMTVEAPEDAENVEIVLYRPGEGGSADAEEVVRAAAEPGRVDLAGLFPRLWTSWKPTVVYAQLEVDGAPVGPGVVLQPMTTPDEASGSSTNIRFQDRSQSIYAGLRAYVDQHIVFDTDVGEIEMVLRPDHAPNTAFNLLHLVEGGFYTDVIVHRIVSENAQGHPFVVQFGDPTGTGAGGPGYFVDLEPSALPHDFGVVSMARSTAPDTNGSQIFICLSREGTALLDGAYTSFGQVVRGADAILEMEGRRVQNLRTNRPRKPPRIRSARTIPAPPYGTGPRPVDRPAPEPVER